MQSDPEVRLPGSRRFASQRSAAAGIEVPDELIAQIEKLCTT
jgi:LDH2 family malate/lactate/ureidoglycolate dehydrogenase